jgi:hypothetical protein
MIHRCIHDLSRHDAHMTEGGESVEFKVHDDMPRLSDAKIITKTMNVHPRLESLDNLIAEFPYMFKLIRRNWTSTHLMAVGLAILGSIVGAWDLGIGELSNGGDYNRMGINPFNPDSGILQANAAAIFLTFLSGALWIAAIVVNWLIYPLMRSHAFYLLGGLITIQIGMMSAHSTSPSFPFDSGFSNTIGLIVAESVLAFILTIIIYRSVTETRDLHVEIQHPHPDSREQMRAARDHSLGGWTVMLVGFAIMVNISAWAGAHHISPRPPFESSRLFTYFLHLSSTWIYIILFNLILWYPQFMLGSSTTTIESERSRQTSISAGLVDEPGTCPNCGETSNAEITEEGIIIAPCREEGCDNKDPVGQDCSLCGIVIQSAILCHKCGIESSVSDLFPLEEAW